MKKIIVTLMTSGLMLSQVYAGFNGLTHHSRANCVNNETISWDWTADHLVKVDSHHHYDDFSGNETHHDMTSGWQNYWRVAAVHWGEGRGGWSVTGKHWMKNRKNQPYLAESEIVYNCSAYDGWWDKNR